MSSTLNLKQAYLKAKKVQTTIQINIEEVAKITALNKIEKALTDHNTNSLNVFVNLDEIPNMSEKVLNQVSNELTQASVKHIKSFQEHSTREGYCYYTNVTITLN